MVSLKYLPLSKRAFDVCWSARCHFSTTMDNLNTSTDSNPASLVQSDSLPKKVEIIKPIIMAFSEYTSSSTVDDAPPLIIMHGLLGSRTNWSSIAKALHVQTKTKVFALDARNHGDSEHSNEMTYSHMAEDVRKFMHDQNIPRAALMGHSMGGRVMMTLALQNPALVSRLVVVDMSPVFVSPTLHLMPRFFDAMDTVAIPRDVSLSEGLILADKQIRFVVKDAGVRKFILTNLIKKFDGGFAWRVNLSGIARAFTQIAIFPAADEKLTYPGPTLFVAGGYSDHIPTESYIETRELFPAASFQKVKEAGHWVHYEKPNEFVQLVTPFLVPGPIEAQK